MLSKKIKHTDIIHSIQKKCRKVISAPPQPLLYDNYKSTV
jgi:hypothetical protein